MIHPSLQTPSAELRQQWKHSGTLRIEQFLAPEHAAAVLDDLRTLPHELTIPSAPGLEFLMATWTSYPDASCGHAPCRLTAWWLSEGLRWVEALIGESLAPPPSGCVISSLYTKGCYLDPHNDKAETRAIAFVLGFTDAQWPAAEGGHLEFLAFDGQAFDVVERRAPGLGSLDLFAVQDVERIHRIPILTEHHERRAMSGWFHVAGTEPEAMDAAATEHGRSMP